MRVGGAYCMLVTGGFVSFADPIAKLLGFNTIRANRLLFDGSQLSGTVEDPIVDAQAKYDALVEVRQERGLRREDVLAIGDGANDRLMVQEAGLGVAYRPKPALAEVADARLDHHGLDALLWVQGIRKKDWVKA
jgi:phosphoserine phosphatase